MLKRSLAIFSAGMLICLTADAQLVNNGEKIFIDKGVLVSVAGDVKNLSGSIENQGQLKLTGDWINNSAQKAFTINSTGKVVFSGADQKIGGTEKTAFPDLEFAGSGLKTLDRDAEVLGRLLLSDRELDIKDNTLSIVNPASSAIERTSGFVNTDRGGKLIRSTNSTGVYLYPFGSSAAGRYRPIEVIPQTAENMSLSATMFNTDPTFRGYDVSSKREDVKSVFTRYFYLVDQVSGSGNTNIKFYLNGSAASSALATEGDVKQLLSWSNFRVWEKAAPSIVTDGNFGDNLTRNLLFTSSAPVRSTAFTFGEASTATIENPLTFFNAFSPDGDGKNDTWTIRNLDLYPDNDVTIFNRWGDEVFKSKNYSSSKAWDGGTFNSGTYYYVLNVKINGAMKSYKGFITMLKKD